MRPGDKVMVKRMREAAERMGSLLFEEEKPKLLRLEGHVGVVDEISGDKTFKVRMKTGEEWYFSAQFLERCDDRLMTASKLCVGDRCSHVDKAGTFTVTQVTPQRLYLQDDVSIARLICDPRKLRKLAPDPEVDEKIRKTMWREYQHEAIEELLRRRRSVCLLRPGAGKTLIALGAFLRMKFDPKCAVRLLPGDIFLVLTEANLVEEVWAKQAWEHGVLEHLHVAKGRGAPDACKQLVVASTQYLTSHLMRDEKVFGERDCTLWHRRVSAVFVDEVHRLGGTHVWNAAVTKLAGKAVVSAGLTGTFFPNDPANAANISVALGLHADLCQPKFWQQPMALQVAAGPRYRCVHRPPEEATRVGAPERPKNPPWRRVSYSARPERCSGQPVVNGISECLDVSPSQAKEFHELSSSADKSRCFDNNDFAPSSKVKAFLVALEQLFQEERHKIFVSVLYLDTLLIVKKFLARRYPQTEGCRVKLFDYHGKLSAGRRSDVLKEFLDRPCVSATRSIMVFSLCAGKTGLNITRGLDSPMAHVEFEQAHLASERFQLQCRVDRDGNPYPVQLVVLEGVNTEESRKMERQWIQANKQKAAGCEDMLKVLSGGNEAELIE